MPACIRCGKGNQPTAELRRTRKGRVCKNLTACYERVRAAGERKAA